MKLSYSKSVLAAGIASVVITLSLVGIFLPSSQPSEPQPQAVAVSSEIPIACNSENKEPFNGKVLYDCVFGVVVKSDLSLMDPAKRSAYIEKWQHRYDQGTMLDDQEHTYIAIKKMVNDLHEMHTAFLPPKEASALLQSTQGNLVGIGAPMMRMGMKSALKALGENPTAEALQSLNLISESTPIVVYPAPAANTPAEKAGLLGGDQIVAVDGKTTIGRTLNEVVDAIKGSGEEGSQVILSVKRPIDGSFTDKEITITRQAVHFPQVSTKLLDNDFLQVKVMNFTHAVAGEFSDALYLACTGKTLPYDTKQLLEVIKAYEPNRDCTLKGLVIDFRNNGGGVMNEALDMGQTLMAKGTTITIQQRDGDRSIEVRQRLEADHYVEEMLENGNVVKSRSTARVFRVLPDVPIVVLVNGMSASASEILAGMLQVNGLATVVGTPSFGKEVGQAFKPIDFGSAVKITTFRFLPGGAALGAGIIPDYEVQLPDAFIDNPFTGEDTQLTKAIEVLARGQAALEEAHSQAAIAAKEKRSIAVQAEHDKRDLDIFAGINGASSN